MRQVVDNKKNCKAPRRLTAADKRKLRKRHIIENLFCRLKQFKRLRNRIELIDWLLCFKPGFRRCSAFCWLNKCKIHESCNSYNTQSLHTHPTDQ
jgi:hypothetical protein